ncbi:ROK family transcriptional regulator [Aestuariimicrobium sp. p3-SID1156]|uniref:ROK family transcriptional regulator n=1 Tax=Aestuariimicrobium sp. p3-SID1156 TaxID=2916038 RepID=UPI00223A77BC|nr:ROK family transcriptional regulator [Aestuariimicrobium sp. p3-SID1156]MCT1459276.1 ROK family transcriptional regulator [Aestuariimicrobium sp. p3-SID1156]
MRAPGSQSSLREANSQRILEAVRTFGAITQVELAAATGLSAATVSNIVKQLECDSVLVTSATTRSGRRAQQVSLAPTSQLAFGVHITARSLRTYLGDISNTVQHSSELPLPVDHRFDTTLDRAALLLGEAVEEVGATLDDVVAVGVALPPNLLATMTGGALHGWEDVDVAETLSRRANRPVVLEQQADAAAMAEARFGSLRGSSCAIYVRAEETIEAAILIRGQLHRGIRGPAGALGHVQVDPSGPICRCGARGCLNTAVSEDALADLLRLSHGPMNLRQIVASAQRGDAGCRQVIADTGAVVGPVLANSALMLHPEAIVIGGALATAGELFLGPIRDALRARPLLGSADELLVASELTRHAEAIGAAALAYDSVQTPGPAGRIVG